MPTSPLPRHLTAVTDLTPGEIETIIGDAFAFKREREAGIPHATILSGKVVSLLFEKPSLRTRIAFEIATASLGGQPIFQSGVEIFSRADGAEREKVSDIAGVLERYCHAIVARVHSNRTILQLAEASSIPVVNALCDLHHPTQALADLMTIAWHKPRYKGLTVAFIGDGNNVATSLMQICAMMGLHFMHGGPASHRISDETWQRSLGYANASGATLRFTENPSDAVADADVLYTDTFVSMGDETETEQRLRLFAHYQVNAEMMSHAKPEAIFLHCLPAHRGEEVTADVIDSHQSKVFDLAECRMHVAKALLKFFLS